MSRFVETKPALSPFICWQHSSSYSGNSVTAPTGIISNCCVIGWKVKECTSRLLAGKSSWEQHLTAEVSVTSKIRGACKALDSQLDHSRADWIRIENKLINKSAHRIGIVAYESKKSTRSANRHPATDCDVANDILLTVQRCCWVWHVNLIRCTREIDIAIWFLDGIDGSDVLKTYRNIRTLKYVHL